MSLRIVKPLYVLCEIRDTFTPAYAGTPNETKREYGPIVFGSIDKPFVPVWESIVLATSAAGSYRAMNVAKGHVIICELTPRLRVDSGTPIVVELPRE